MCFKALRRRGSEPQTRWAGEWRPSPPPEATARRALVMRSRPISVANSCTVKTSALPDLARLLISASISSRLCTALEDCRWNTYLAGGSSSGELRADRTGPTINSLPWPQTALKRCASAVSSYLRVITFGLCPSVREK